MAHLSFWSFIKHKILTPENTEVSLKRWIRVLCRLEQSRKRFPASGRGFCARERGLPPFLLTPWAPACSACPPLHRLPEHLRLEGPWDVFSSHWPKASGPHVPKKATPCCHAPYPHHGIGDSCPGERVQGVNTKLKPTFLSPKKFPVAFTSLFAPALLQFSVFFMHLINESIH